MERSISKDFSVPYYLTLFFSFMEGCCISQTNDDHIRNECIFQIIKCPPCVHTHTNINTSTHLKVLTITSFVFFFLILSPMKTKWFEWSKIKIHISHPIQFTHKEFLVWKILLFTSNQGINTTKQIPWNSRTIQII